MSEIWDNAISRCWLDISWSCKMGGALVMWAKGSGDCIVVAFCLAVWFLRLDLFVSRIISRSSIETASSVGSRCGRELTLSAEVISDASLLRDSCHELKYENRFYLEILPPVIAGCILRRPVMMRFSSKLVTFSMNYDEENKGNVMMACASQYCVYARV